MHRAIDQRTRTSTCCSTTAYRERRLGGRTCTRRTWLPLLEQDGVRLQVCAVYVNVVVQPQGSLREALSMVASFQRACAESAGRVVQVTTASDLDAWSSGERIEPCSSPSKASSAFGVETWPAEHLPHPRHFSRIAW